MKKLTLVFCFLLILVSSGCNSTAAKYKTVDKISQDFTIREAKKILTNFDEVLGQLYTKTTSFVINPQTNLTIGLEELLKEHGYDVSSQPNKTAEKNIYLKIIAKDLEGLFRITLITSDKKVLSQAFMVNYPINANGFLAEKIFIPQGGISFIQQGN